MSRIAETKPASPSAAFSSSVAVNQLIVHGRRKLFEPSRRVPCLHWIRFGPRRLGLAGNALLERHGRAASHRERSKVVFGGVDVQLKSKGCPVGSMKSASFRESPRDGHFGDKNRH